MIRKMKGKNNLIWAVVVSIVIFMAACTSDESSLDIDMAEIEKPHYYYDIVVHRGYLYATSPWGLDVFSCNGGKLTHMGGFETHGESQTLALYKDRLYLSDITGRLYVFDAAKPENLSLIRELLLNKTAQKIVAAQDRAYLACVSSGLVILDINKLEEIGLFKPYDYSYPKGLYLKNRSLFIADFTVGLHITEIKGDSIVSVAIHPTSSVAHDVLVIGDYAYVACSDGGIDVFRISGDEIEKIENLPLPGYTLRIVRYKDYLMATLANRGVALLKIKDDHTLELIKVYDTLGNAYGIAIADNFAYVADYSGGIAVFDLSRVPELMPVAVIKPEVIP